MIKKLCIDLLVWLGYRSTCCHAPTYYVMDYEQTYCSKCLTRQ